MVWPVIKVVLQKALKKIPELREEFWENLYLNGSSSHVNQQLEHAGRVADFLEFGELMCRDALTREESVGGTSEKSIKQMMVKR